VVAVLTARCDRLTEVSRANRALRRLVHALSAAQAARAAVTAVPIAGPIAAAAGEATLATMRAAARGLARTQDALLELGRVSDLAVVRCGQPEMIPGRLALERSRSPEAVLARVPAPLEWRSPPASTELSARAWDLRTESYGWCAPPQDAAPLDGERYEARLTHPDTGRRRSKWFL
jgi:hypothetical protein